MLTNAPKPFINMIPWFFVAIGFFLMWVIWYDGTNRADRNFEASKTNQFYSRLVACLASETPIKRTPEYTEHCYDEVERQTGIHAERYGTAQN